MCHCFFWQKVYPCVWYTLYPILVSVSGQSPRLNCCRVVNFYNAVHRLIAHASFFYPTCDPLSFSFSTSSPSSSPTPCPSSALHHRRLVAPAASTHPPCHHLAHLHRLVAPATPKSPKATLSKPGCRRGPHPRRQRPPSSSPPHNRTSVFVCLAVSYPS